MSERQRDRQIGTEVYPAHSLFTAAERSTQQKLKFSHLLLRTCDQFAFYWRIYFYSSLVHGGPKLYIPEQQRIIIDRHKQLIIFNDSLNECTKRHRPILCRYLFITSISL